MEDAIAGYRTECVLEFDGGWIEVRQFQVIRPAECVWMTSPDSYFIDISLTPRLYSMGTPLRAGHGSISEAMDYA